MVKRKYFSRRRSTLSSLGACRTLKTVVKWTFWTSPSDPFVTSCVSDDQNCGKMHVFVVLLWCCGGVVVVFFVVVFLWWCGGVVCGGVVVVFLWWCSCFFVVVWWCFFFGGGVAVFL